MIKMAFYLLVSLLQTHNPSLIMRKNIRQITIEWQSKKISDQHSIKLPMPSKKKKFLENVTDKRILRKHDN